MLGNRSVDFPSGLRPQPEILWSPQRGTFHLGNGHSLKNQERAGRHAKVYGQVVAAMRRVGATEWRTAEGAYFTWPRGRVLIKHYKDRGLK